MHGFIPRRAKEQKFADGGFVTNVKRMFGMDAERNAQIAEYKARAAAEKAQAQQSAQPAQAQPQQRAVSEYSGMSATQRREKELGLKDGGRVQPRGFVQGPGTGTSDSIKARLSNGEYVLPADTVKAVGVDTLDAIKAATHTPVKGEQAKAARGFFAGGGSVNWLDEQDREMNQRKQEALSAGEAAASAAASVPEAKPAPALGAPMPGTKGADLVAAELAKPQQRAATGMAIKDALQAPFGKGSSPATPMLTAPSAPTAPVPITTQNATDVRLAAGTMGSPATIAGALNQPKPEAPGVPNPTETQAREVVPGVYNHGRGQYSDDPTGMNMPKGFTGQPSAANNAILERMSDQSKAESMARLGFGPQAQYAAEVQRAKNINADEAARNNSVGARMQRLADPFTAEGRAMRNLQMNIDSSLDRKGRPTAETAALVAQSKAMSDGYLAEPNQQRTIEAGLEREGMQQAGENQRTGIRAGLEQQRINQSGAELGLRTEAAGFQTRAAQRRESVYDNYSKAKTDEDRQAIAKQFPDLFGQAKDAAHRMEVVRGKTDPMTGQSSGDYVVVQDPKTGEVRQIQMGAASAAPTQGALPKVATPQDLAALKSGTRFVDSNGVERIKK